jgi:ankyrin repeat protein
MGPGATPFLRASKSADLEMMRLLLDKGANPLLATSSGTTALMVAAGTGWRDGKSRGSEADAIDALQMLLDGGADVNAASDTGETAFHGAAGRGADSVLAFLAAHGADVNAKDKKGRTALDIAMGVGADVGGVRSPHESTVALLKKLTESSSAKNVGRE